MEPKKSIRDISASKSDIISDMISEQPVIKKIRKVVQPKTIVDQEDLTETYLPEHTPEIIKNQSSKISVRKLVNLISQIRPVYLIGLLLIVALALVLVFMPSPAVKDPVEQAKAEAEIVKKQLSKHIVFPENEQIDIRKITNKMEDPFFQNAEIGDYLVIFYKNRIAYIYSIEKDIIVNAGVVFIDSKTATTTGTTTDSTTTGTTSKVKIQ